MSYITPQFGTVASVTGTTASVPVFPAASGNVNGRVVYNDSSAILYLKFGTLATVQNYTVQVPAGGYFEFPVPTYSGEADGIWASIAGSARTTSW